MKNQDILLNSRYLEIRPDILTQSPDYIELSVLMGKVLVLSKGLEQNMMIIAMT